MARVAGSSRETGNLRRGADKPCTLRSAASAMNERRIRVCAEISPSEEGFGVLCLPALPPSRADDEIATLKAGQFFGEQALVSNQPRNAFVRCAERPRQKTGVTYAETQSAPVRVAPSHRGHNSVTN